MGLKVYQIDALHEQLCNEINEARKVNIENNLPEIDNDENVEELDRLISYQQEVEEKIMELSTIIKEEYDIINYTSINSKAHLIRLIKNNSLLTNSDKRDIRNKIIISDLNDGVDNIKESIKNEYIN